MGPLRLVLDTNVVVSAVLNPHGNERAIARFALRSDNGLIMSSAIRNEYRTVLARRKFYAVAQEARRFVDDLEAAAVFVTSAPVVGVARDPKDDMFLGCAEAGGADYLVTGNLRDFPSSWGRTRIVSATILLNVLGEELGFGRKR